MASSVADLKEVPPFAVSNRNPGNITQNSLWWHWSWRALILPFMEGQTVHNRFASTMDDQPRHQQGAVKQMVNDYRNPTFLCPNRNLRLRTNDGFTNAQGTDYLAICHSSASGRQVRRSGSAGPRS